jgi:hypothetical protein
MAFQHLQAVSLHIDKVGCRDSFWVYQYEFDAIKLDPILLCLWHTSL